MVEFELYAYIMSVVGLCHLYADSRDVYKRQELELVDGVYPEFNVEEYLKGEMAPVFFGSALNNFCLLYTSSA